MVRPYQIVDPPMATVLPYGLMSVVEPLDVTNGHWQTGVAWQSRCPNVTLTYDECLAVTGLNAPPAQPSYVDNVDVEDRAATAFSAYVEIDCSPVGSGDLAEYVRKAYNAVEPYAVERAFWTGKTGNNLVTAFPHLAAATQVVDADSNILQTAAVTGGAFNPANALGFLENQMAQCLGTVGVVHIPRRALPAFAANGLVSASGGRLKTASGNLVAAGSGYDGSSPVGAAPSASQAWIYGTGQVFGVWGDIRVSGMPESFDRANNTMMVTAERTYLFGWDCCHVGVLVDLANVV